MCACTANVGGVLLIASNERTFAMNSARLVTGIFVALCATTVVACAPADETDGASAPLFGLDGPSARFSEKSFKDGTRNELQIQRDGEVLSYVASQFGATVSAVDDDDRNVVRPRTADLIAFGGPSGPFRAGMIAGNTSEIAVALKFGHGAGGETKRNHFIAIIDVKKSTKNAPSYTIVGKTASDGFVNVTAIENKSGGYKVTTTPLPGCPAHVYQIDADRTVVAVSTPAAKNCSTD
jgi:hypothetical protein